MKLILILSLVSVMIIGCQSVTPNNELTVQPQTSVPQTSVKVKTVPPQVSELEAGKSAYAKGDYEGAVELYGTWIEKNPQDANAYTERGRAHDKLRHYDLALQDFQKASEMNTESLRPKVYATGSLYAANRTEEAYESLQGVMSDAGFRQLNPYERFLVYLLLAQFQLKANDTDGALKSLNTAMDTYRNHNSTFVKQGSGYIHRLVHQSRSVAYHQQGNYQQVAVELESYIQLSEKGNATVSSKDHMSLAMAYYMTQQFDKCRNLMDKVTPQDREKLRRILKEDLFVTSDN